MGGTEGGRRKKQKVVVGKRQRQKEGGGRKSRREEGRREGRRREEEEEGGAGERRRQTGQEGSRDIKCRESANTDLYLIWQGRPSTCERLQLIHQRIEEIQQKLCSPVVLIPACTSSHMSALCETAIFQQITERQERVLRVCVMLAHRNFLHKKSTNLR